MPSGSTPFSVSMTRALRLRSRLKGAMAQHLIRLDAPDAWTGPEDQSARPDSVTTDARYREVRDHLIELDSKLAAAHAGIAEGVTTLALAKRERRSLRQLDYDGPHHRCVWHGAFSGTQREERIARLDAQIEKLRKRLAAYRTRTRLHLAFDPESVTLAPVAVTCGIVDDEVKLALDDQVVGYLLDPGIHFETSNALMAITAWCNLPHEAYAAAPAVGIVTSVRAFVLGRGARNTDVFALSRILAEPNLRDCFDHWPKWAKSHPFEPEF